MQPDEFADVVVGVVKAAMAPLQERLATAEQCNRDLQARVTELLSLRDRLVVVETKGSFPNPPDAAFYELRDRVFAVESKSTTQPSSIELLADFTRRLETLEARPVATPAATEKAVDLSPVLERLAVAEAKLVMVDARSQDTLLNARVQDDSLTKELGSLRERVAVVEVRPPVAGPQGEPGPAGKDGVNGKDGTAGLSFEGVYQEGKSYELGNLVTWAGSSWHANESTTSKPGDGSKAWTLMVKRGRDGRDGHDAAGALPVVSVGRAQ